MEIKNNIKFESFRNGIVDIYETDGANKLGRCKESGLRFGYRTVGIKRFYAARGAQVDPDSSAARHLHAGCRRNQWLPVQNCTDTADLRHQPAGDGLDPQTNGNPDGEKE